MRLLGAAAALRGLTERFPTQRSDGLRCFSTTSIVHSPPGRGAPTRSPGSQRAQNNVTKTTPFQYLKTLLWYRGGWAGTLWIRSPSCRSAADSHAYSHERPERPTALHHRFANSAHQLSSSHADPEIKKKAEVTPKLKPGADIHSRNQLAQPANGRRGVQIRSPFSSLQREAMPSGSASSRRPEPPQGTAELVCTAAPCPGGSSIPAASQTPLTAGAQLKGEPVGVAPQLHTLRAPAVGWAAQGAQRGGSVSH